MEMQDLISFITDELLDSGTSITEDDELLMSDLLDSIGVMRLVMYIEQQTQVRVPPEDITIETFTSVRTITEYLHQKPRTT